MQYKFPRTTLLIWETFPSNTQLWLCKLVSFKSLISPLGKRAWSLTWTNLNPHHPICFVSRLKLAMWFRRKWFSYVVYVFLLLFLLEKDVAFHFHKLKFLLPKDLLCHIWLKLAQWFWREEDDNVKSLQTDKWTDKGQQVIRRVHLSFQVRWAKNVYLETWKFCFTANTTSDLTDFTLHHFLSLIMIFDYHLSKRFCQKD